MKRFDIRPATHHEAAGLMRSFVFATECVHVATIDGKAVALGGLASPTFANTLLDDEVWGYFEVMAEAGVYANRIIRYMRGIMDQSGHETILIQCDDDHATAPKLLKLLGFKPTDQLREDQRDNQQSLRVWKWQK